jgi:predicted GIY-YIG superfamily endonuclease
MENSDLVKIYLLTDDKGLKYVGKTPRSMSQRISEHKYDRKRCGCSSGKLNLDCVSYEILEEVPNIKSYVKEREGYWIQNTDCVNQQKNYNVEQYKIYQRDYMRKLRLELKLMSQFLKLLEDY